VVLLLMTPFSLEVRQVLLLRLWVKTPVPPECVYLPIRLPLFKYLIQKINVGVYI